jgi:hypothetical protein
LFIKQSNLTPCTKQNKENTKILKILKKILQKYTAKKQRKYKKYLKSYRKSTQKYTAIFKLQGPFDAF